MNPAPPLHTQCRLVRDDGSEVLGWRIYDGVLGRSRYWSWGDEAKRPSRFTSAWQRAGVFEVHPVSWRPYDAPVMDMPEEPLALREVDVMARRAVLTDGTMLRSGQSLIFGSWDAIQTNNTMALIDQKDIEIFERFTPERFDLDNWLTAMDWLARINNKSQGFGDWNREQNTIIFRAYDYSFNWIGEEVLGDVSKQRAQTVYRSAIDKVWRVALASKTQVRRLPRHLWQRRSASHQESRGPPRL